MLLGRQSPHLNTTNVGCAAVMGGCLAMSWLKLCMLWCFCLFCIEKIMVTVMMLTGQQRQQRQQRPRQAQAVHREGAEGRLHQKLTCQQCSRQRSDITDSRGNLLPVGLAGTL